MAYNDVVLLYSDGTNSEPISGIAVIYDKLTREDAIEIIEMTNHQDGDYAQRIQNFQKTFADRLICPTCDSLCTFLSNGCGYETSEEGTIINFEAELLEYCESCGEVYAIGYKGEGSFE